MRTRRLAHSVYQVAYHIVWGTKYRRKILKEYVKAELIRSITRTQRRYPDWYILKLNTGDDHVHMLIEFPPTDAVAAVVRELTATTSAALRKQFPFIDRVYPRGNMWSTGYFVSTVGLNEEQIRRYIENQNQYERGIDAGREFS